MAEIELTLDALSYTLIALLIAVLVIPAVLSRDPDVHPFVLHRQSAISPVRNPKESAVYRSTDTPFGYPLVSGLGLPAAQKYASRTGDIRDIWKLAIEHGKGKMQSVKGKEVVDFSIADLTKHIYAVGSHFRDIGAKSVAVYLPNDVENLVVSFACAFYNIKLIIVPFEPHQTEGVLGLLKETRPDVIIAAAGQVPLEEITPIRPKEIIFVVEPGSQHLDWDSPEGSDQKSVVYHEIIKNGAAKDPEVDIELNAPAVVIYGPKQKDGSRELIEFSHRNIVAGVASQMKSLPTREKYTPNDVFVPVDTLADLHTRIHTYAALASGSTVALSSIAGKHADIETAVRNVNPTIIVVSPESLLELHIRTRGTMMELWHGMIHYFQARTLTNNGRIPKGNFITRVNDYIRPRVGKKLRLVFVAESAGSPDSQPLNSLDLSDLRVFFQAKVVYGLKHYKVAGPVTQCNVYDYRVQKQKSLPKGPGRECAHFGAPSPGLEIKLKDRGEYTADDAEGPRGEVWVTGPVVAGGRELSLGIVGKWEDEGVLSYA
ncbi:hypothetical protein EX30DRAFT_323949 [Ascodesmis nigricans]|uniref:AMP-dependent synthetase/ligase domain-containing protein n=1 Tax=Ascodesmis nigricans TaxID=341454 RepID=A0A4S2MJL9_9PEZI|nr:hypothetical protein EX30DRAFT_323949 [Ascodesmis nigricans]